MPYRTWPTAADRADPSTGKSIVSSPPSGYLTLAGLAPTVTAPIGYSTSFGSAQTPWSDGGQFNQGLADGLDWFNINTSIGKAFSSAITPDNSTVDGIACLKSTTYGKNQKAFATAARTGGYTAPSSHEIELLVNFKISGDSARGYEATFPIGASCQIVRWNGSLGNFTVLSTTGPGISGLAAGDAAEFYREISTDNLVLKVNSVEVMRAVDTTFLDGAPGLGQFVRTGGTPSSYCWASWGALKL